jgi:DNA-binding NtrC family response regulator
MSPQLQAKLLHVAQDGRFQRIGSNRSIVANARILTATNRHLEEEVKNGRFREDLYYRLNVVELNLPSLRERAEDILPLATHFVDQFSQGRARLSASTTACLERYTWPGNVRELRNAMERACLLSRGELILPDHLPARVRQPAAPTPLSNTASSLATASATISNTPGKDSPSPIVDAQCLEEIERQAVLSVLQKNQYNRTETAKALGISRRALIYKLQRLRELGYVVDPS